MDSGKPKKTEWTVELRYPESWVVCPACKRSLLISEIQEHFILAHTVRSLPREP